MKTELTILIKRRLDLNPHNYPDSCLTPLDMVRLDVQQVKNGEMSLNELFDAYDIGVDNLIAVDAEAI